MSKSAQKSEDDSYGKLLGEYFTVVTEIASMLDEFGRPDPEHRFESTRLNARKSNLHEALEATTPDYEETEIESILEKAFKDQKSFGIRHI